MIKEGSRVEITFGTFEGKHGTVLGVNERNRSVDVLVDGTKIEIEKGIKREVKVIEEGNALEQFLAQWKAAAAEYYWNLKNEMQEVKNADYEINEENLKSIVSSTMGKRQYSDTKIEKMLNSELPSYQVRNLKIEIAHAKYNEWVSGKTLADVNFVRLLDTKEDLSNALDGIVKEKKYKFMAKVEKKAGEILDMSGLGFGHDGSINGTVIGKERTVTVKTVFAGGHSVQCLHYRVMVK